MERWRDGDEELNINNDLMNSISIFNLLVAFLEICFIMIQKKSDAHKKVLFI